jgi:hypothetical protein
VPFHSDVSVPVALLATKPAMSYVEYVPLMVFSVEATIPRSFLAESSA